MLPLIVMFVLAAAGLSFIFQAAGNRADTTLLQRYCDAPEAHVAKVARILDSADPAAGGKRRPYIIAAKLIYIIPQQSGESDGAYLARLAARLEQVCR
jgi:hypothetical protein